MNPEPGFSRFRLGGVVLVLAAASTVGILWAVQRNGVHREAERLGAQVDAGPRLRVALVSPGGPERTVQVPGEATPYASTTLFAKVSGFLKEIRVDKGSPVKGGQVLAILESPEVDRDTQALKADADNKRSYAARLAELSRQGIVSARDLEDAQAQARIALEKLASQATLQAYTQVLAPFSGVVVQRFVDPGAMIQNAGSSSAAQPIVSLAQVDRLRVAFYVDQQLATRIRPGQALDVHPTDRPDLLRSLQVARIAGALDSRTRTLLVEADLDNRDGAFVAGGAVKVQIKLPQEAGKLEIPSEAVLARGTEAFAVLAGADGRVRMARLVLGEDTGSRVRILGGLQAGQLVVLNPPATLQEGDRIQAVEVKP